MHRQTVATASGWTDYAGTLAWHRSQSEAGGISDIMLADHTDIESPAGTDLYGFLVHSGGSDCLKRVFADHASIVDTCRDAVSGQVHSVIHLGSGQYSDVEIWSVDPTTGEPVRAYSEGWVDSYEDGEWDLVTPDGQCIWRERQSDLKAISSAVQALRIGDEDEEALSLHGVDELPVRPLARETVLRSLDSLERIATIEGAVYASDEDHAGWRVVQIRGNAICNAYGIVLVLNRMTGQWYSIYDVASGCSKSLDYPFYGMRVNDGHLIVSACIHCSGHGDYAGFSINLETWRVQPLDAEDLSEWDPFYRENPRIQNIVQDSL